MQLEQHYLERLDMRKLAFVIAFVLLCFLLIVADRYSDRELAAGVNEPKGSLNVEMKLEECEKKRQGCSIVHARLHGDMKGRDYWCTGTIWEVEGSSKASDIPTCDRFDYDPSYVPIRNYFYEVDLGLFNCSPHGVRFTLVKGSKKLAQNELVIFYGANCQ